MATVGGGGGGGRPSSTTSMLRHFCPIVLMLVCLNASSMNVIFDKALYHGLARVYVVRKARMI
jgi:hypothetical protein